MNNFSTILPVLCSLIIHFLDSFFNGAWRSLLKSYLFLYNWLLYIFPGGLLRFLSITVSLFWFLFYSFVNSWLCRFFSGRHLNLLFCNIRLSPITSFRWIFCNLRFWLWLSLPEISNVFTPSYLQLHSSILSFVPPLGSICRYRVFSDRRASLFGPVSRFRFSIAGITFRFYRSMGALAYGPSSFLREVIAGLHLSHLAVLGLRLFMVSTPYGALHFVTQTF